MTYFSAVKLPTFGYDPPCEPGARQFVAYFFFVGWDTPLQLGFSLCLSQPNLEIHIPFGFVRIGWVLNPQLPEAEA